MAVRSTRVAALSILAACLASPVGVALAHGGEEHGPMDRGHLRPFIEIDTTYGAFDFGDRRGSYTGMTLRGEYDLADFLLVGGAASMYALRRADADAVTGPGDLELSVRGLVVNRSDLALSLGVTAELPTGDEGRRIGDGHAMLRPTVIVGAGRGKIWLQAMVGDSIALASEEAETEASDGHQHDHAEGGSNALGSFIGPHSHHELIYEVGATLGYAEPIAVTLAVGGATVIAAEGRGDTPLWLGPQLMWRPSTSLRLTIGGQLPLTEPRRFDGRLSVGARLVF